MENIIAKLNNLIELHLNGDGSEFDVGFIIGVKQAIAAIESQPPSSNSFIDTACTCLKSVGQTQCDNSCKVPSSKDVKTAEQYLKEYGYTLCDCDSCSGNNKRMVDMLYRYASQFNPPSGGGSKEDAEFLREMSGYVLKGMGERLKRIASNIEQGK